MDSIIPLAQILIFPGFLFLASYGMMLQWVDRKLCAVMQNRMGPPWFQPLADFIKLLAKEVIVPDEADNTMFRVLPYFALAAVMTAMVSIPVGEAALFSFQGDLVAVIYLLTIPTVTFFLAGWSSKSPYSTVGSMRVLTQLFAYEVPLMLSLIGPAILAGSWNIAEISSFFAAHPALIPAQLLGFLAAIIALQGKLERLPFDIPHAKNEIAGGQFTEYSGRLLDFFLLAVDMELVVGAALLNAVFLGGALGLTGAAAIVLFLAKTLAITFLLALLKVLMARIRIEQMINFCWKYLAPVAMAQVLFDIFLKYKLG
ncbi:MAG: NADH dehydrogenase [Elusimicrobia bacterium GWA2_64_40]|nr:MAG: NADH dehydrogenase [Elusimicrobia bacterium GWA2_64_40]OGR63448.1 MAG: NADH dehydrogenase [Elusimicrobia bacterium GWB2_63_16]HAN05708.1 NADH-quinone oxidoreductase subunit H [Elusimicrobiota bacterium]